MRAAILQVAKQLIEEGGLKAITIRAIASRLGYSPGAIYEYFDSKELILISLFYESEGGFTQTAQEAIDALPDSANAIDHLLALGHAYRAHALANREMFELVSSFGKIPSAGDTHEHAGGGLFQVTDTIIQGYESGLIRRGDVLTDSLAAWSIAHGFTLLELTGRTDIAISTAQYASDAPDLSRIYDAVLRTFVAGVVTEQGKAYLESRQTVAEE